MYARAVELGVNVVYKLKPDAFTIGNETQAPLIDLIPATTVLTVDDLAYSDELLQTKVSGTASLSSLPWLSRCSLPPSVSALQISPLY